MAEQLDSKSVAIQLMQLADLEELKHGEGQVIDSVSLANDGNKILVSRELPCAPEDYNPAKDHGELIQATLTSNGLPSEKALVAAGFKPERFACDDRNDMGGYSVGISFAKADLESLAGMSYDAVQKTRQRSAVRPGGNLEVK